VSENTAAEDPIISTPGSSFTRPRRAGLAGVPLVDEGFADTSFYEEDLQGARGLLEEATSSRTFVEHLCGGTGFWNSMRLYPEESLGVMPTCNATRYDHESTLDATAGVGWT
jgi:hypothetical protein